MGFVLNPGKAVGDELRRVALEQIDAALVHLRSPGEPGAAVHEARKSCKRVRAVLRLVRPQVRRRRYALLDAAVRDAARELSSSRDAEALVAMFDDLVAAHSLVPTHGLVPTHSLVPTLETPASVADLAVVRSGLEARIVPMSEDPTSAGLTMARAGDRLAVARESVANLRLDAKGFSGVHGGLTATYRQGRVALAQLRHEASTERSHEWRKAVKYTWHHHELLQVVAPSVLGPAGRGFHQLADSLGDAHNLAVLDDLLEASPEGFGGPACVEPVLLWARSARGALEDRAIRLGMRLYAERPKAFGVRLHAYWGAQRATGEELATGELADLTAQRAWPGE